MADVSAILRAGDIPQPPNMLDQYGKMQSILQSRQNVANMEIEGQQKQQELMSTRNAYISGRLATLAYAGPEMQTPEHYNQVLDEVEHLGGDPTMIQNFRAMIPGKSPQELQQLASRTGMALAPPQIQQAMAKPDRMNADTGQELQHYVIPQPGMPGQNIPVRDGQPTVQLYPSRGTLATQQEGVDTRLYLDDAKTQPNPNYGQPIKTTTAGRLNEQGRPDLGGPAGQPPLETTQGGGAPSPQNPPHLNMPPPPASGAATGGSSQPPATTTPTTPPANTGATNAPPGSVAVGTPPGLTTPFKASSDLYAQHQQDAASYATRTFPLAKAYQLASEGVHTGPGTDFWSHIYATVQAQAPDWVKSHLPIDMSENDKRQELGKYLSQNLMNMPFAKASDQMMAQALTGTPGTHLTTLPLQDVVKAQYGLMRMQQAGTLQFQKEHPGLTAQAASGQYAQWLGDWQRNIDPRAFMYDMMTKDQKHTMLNGMSDKEVARWQQSVQTAKNLDLLDQKAPRE